MEIIKRELPEKDHHWVKSLKSKYPENFFRAWLEKQVYIALGIGLSSCIQLGLDSTPMEGILPDEYIDILQMRDYRPLFAMAVGYAAPNDPKSLQMVPKSRRHIDDVIKSV